MIALLEGLLIFFLISARNKIGTFVPAVGCAKGVFCRLSFDYCSFDVNSYF